jgi:hypothetical protein
MNRGSAAVPGYHPLALTRSASMFRLIKLAFYFLIGYALYELYLGFTQENTRGQFGTSPQRGGRAGGQTVTGGGQGAIEQTEEPSGMSVRHNVGRGVVPH